MRENAAAKGSRYLTEGRLIVLQVQRGYVRAVCRGDGVVHRLWFNGTCPVRTDQCSHLSALRRVVAVDLEEPT